EYYFVDGNYRYQWGNALVRIDFSNSKSMTRLGDLDVPGNFAGASFDGSYIYCYEAREFYHNWLYDARSSGDTFKNGTFYVLSTENDVATVVKAFNMPWNIRRVLIEDDMAVLISTKWGQSGFYHFDSKEDPSRFKVWLIDLSDPNSPKLRGSFHGVGGLSGAYLLKNNLILELNYHELAVYDLSNPGKVEFVGMFPRVGWTHGIKIFHNILFQVAGYYGIVGFPLDG
ncbi:MAG TPA: hypothetical protein ENN76_00065, partial [Euryarchaeota archaeon]|nr:hypothetical protein [Euryarchaeota archaeon]